VVPPSFSVPCGDGKIRFFYSFNENNTKRSCQTSLYEYSDKGYMSKAIPIMDLCTIYFDLQIKSNRYRVTVTDIVWEQTMGMGVGVGSGISITGNNLTKLIHLKDIAIGKKGKVKFKLTGGLEKQLNYCLGNLFSSKNYKEIIQNSNILNTDF
jgi:hypothetical protein